MAPRKATLSGSRPVGSDIWGKRGWSGVGTGEGSIVDGGVGVITSHTTRAHTHSKPQRRRMIRAEAGGTGTRLPVSRVITFLLTSEKKSAKSERYIVCL
jgi:hypothetical protein